MVLRWRRQERLIGALWRLTGGAWSLGGLGGLGGEEAIRAILVEAVVVVRGRQLTLMMAVWVVHHGD